MTEHATAPTTCQKTLPQSVYNIVPNTQIIMELRGVQNRIKTRYVGQERGRFFLLRMPPQSIQGNLYEHLYPGNAVVIRYILAGNIWGFATRVQGHIAHPHPLLFLDFPRQVESYNLRKEKRVECSFPVTCLIGGTDADAIMLDLSVLGCRITLPCTGSDPELGTQIGIDCSVFLANGPKRIVGTIRRISRVGANLELGIGFHEPAPEVTNKIRSYVDMVYGLLAN
ncbi:hypothetical protein GGQ74_000991 [Desulfobaculum xiamenense]|uniref:Flagellar brake protein n=1 Tax=Desulfobaculum xiamenense TaxID=995050 RepID=A0A846QGJ1_9BACT|nr:flagellar brake protein [Desulfobaculum xiamenense]NJB67351.1 hypothetical protein [Desulfobaculum xiamenense]